VKDFPLVDTPKKTLETTPKVMLSLVFSIAENYNQHLRPPDVDLPKSNMSSHGVQYTVDRTERGIVSNGTTVQPMQGMALSNNIPAIRAYKDARTARIKAIGEKSQSAFSVGGPANETAMGRGTPFNSDFI
jgi:hypothetical protein